MKNKGIAAISAVLTLSVVGCIANPVNKAETQLTTYIEEYDFSKFTPPRTEDGVGTAISFNQRKQESIVSARETCLPARSVPSLPKPDPVAVLSGTYKITKSNDLEIGLTKVLTQSSIGVPVDVTSVIGVNGVEAIEIQFVEPFRDRIERVKAKDYIRALAEDDSCREEFMRDSTLLIHTVLGAKGIKYGFVGSGGQRITINAEITDALNVGNKYKNEWEGKLGFDVTGVMLIGYRSWKAADVSGSNVPDIDLIALSSEEVDAVRDRQGL